MTKRQQSIEVVAYDPAWPVLFATEARLIEPVFGENLVAIHHIGSTSVPGLAAKPTIDMLIEVKEIALVDDCNQAMEKLNYEVWGEYGIPGRRFFVKGQEKRTHHVHVFQTGTADVNRHLYFRDYLTAHPAIANEYADLKLRLAAQFKHDRRAYVLGKHDYVRGLEQQAIAWSEGKK